MILDFNAKLYSKRAVMGAVKRFKPFGKFSVKETKKAYRVSIAKIVPEHADTLPGEFSNYVLMSMQENY